MATSLSAHPTIVDVARIANVAPSTASRALKENPRISERHACARARPWPAISATSRTGSPSRCAGATAPSSASSCPTSGSASTVVVVKGAQDLLEDGGHQVLLMNTGRDAEREEAALETLLEHRVRGVIVATSARQTTPPRVPTVFFDNLVPEHGVANVALANHEGVDVLVRHLRRTRPHARIGYIGGPPTFTSGIERLDSFRDAIARLGLDERRRYIELADAQWTPASGAARAAPVRRARRPAHGGRHLRRHVGARRDERVPRARAAHAGGHGARLVRRPVLRRPARSADHRARPQ